MLGANTHNLAHLILFFEHIEAIASRSAFSRLDQTSQHADRGGFTRTILSEQSKNLVLVDLHIEALDCMEVVIVDLFEVLDAQVRAVEALPSDFRSHRLIITLVKVSYFHLVRFIVFTEQVRVAALRNVILTLVGDVTRSAALGETLVRAWEKAEAGVRLTAVLLRQHRVTVETEQCPKD